jgi:hypothetical protein
MAISEACQFEIEEDVDKACEQTGVSKKEAFETLKTFYNKIGIEIKFSTIKSKYYRAKEKVANATSEEEQTCKKCGLHIFGHVFRHGLCKRCRKKELNEAAREDAEKRLEGRQEEFDRTPIDTNTEEIWNDLINKFGSVVIDVDDQQDIPCGKVSEETLEKIQNFRSQLYGLVGYLNEVIEQSEVSVRVQ